MNDLERYLKENVDADAVILGNDEFGKLPLFLRDIYSFFRISLLDVDFILLAFKDRPVRINDMVKQLELIRSETRVPLAFYHKAISSYRKIRYLEQRIPFIVADGQMYLPFMGLALWQSDFVYRENSMVFKSTTQLAFLFFLYNKEKKINTSEFAKAFKLSDMTASRALNELQQKGLIRYERGGLTGRSKIYRRIADPDYYRLGKQYLKTPVRRSVYVKNAPRNLPFAGLDALSRQSMISPPDHQVKAVYVRNFDDSEINVVAPGVRYDYDRLDEIQLWEYDPFLVGSENCADPLSLYLSLEEEKDERIRQALNSLMKGNEWYTD